MFATFSPAEADDINVPLKKNGRILYREVYFSEKIQTD